ncbi:hypothetical protein AAFF_G00205100 [Aldrovandia affinis]|uniref:Ig-like domain-containing protein n=1 Tax=Aldrovandia affinis TaxID=143900 RepID=A0AAD7RHW7_9TELE|nr:hypothetical protein AAFF_G00205100 [Aldrovandia affinis]
MISSHKMCATYQFFVITNKDIFDKMGSATIFKRCGCIFVALLLTGTEYHFRFKTTPINAYTGEPGVTLSVTDLQVKANLDTVTEEQSVTMNCTTTCPLSGSPAFIWYKNGLHLSKTYQNYLSNNYLQFKASSEDAGNYSCAVRGHETLPSPAVTLSVRYGPKNTSVSVSPSGEIVEGSSVTLTCSSNANPLVQRYTWFKKNIAIPTESGESYTITNISSEDSGQYYLKGSSVTLTCSSNANPPVERYTWFKKNETEVWQTGSGQSLNFSNFRSWNSGQYYCKAENKHGDQDSTTVAVTTVMYDPKISLYIIAGTTVFAALFLIGMVWIVWRIRRSSSIKETILDTEGNTNNLYANISGMTTAGVVIQENPLDQEEVQYSTVHRLPSPKRQEILSSSAQLPPPNSQGEILYANFQKPSPQDEDDVQYANIQFSRSSAAPSSPVPNVEDTSVIYSTVARQST